MGICTCNRKTEDTKFYLEFMESLKINTVKSEDLVKKIKEKYLTVIKEDKKKAALLNEIFPMIDSSLIELREFSQNYFISYFEENKKNFLSLILFCDKESNFKRSFDEVFNINKKELAEKFSSDKSSIRKEYLSEIVYNYLKFSTYSTAPFIEKISGSENTGRFFYDLFDPETLNAVVKDLMQNFESDDMIALDSFFSSNCFLKIRDRNEILKMFLTYDGLKTKKK